jgi:zinc transport system substrate-binding protein
VNRTQVVPMLLLGLALAGCSRPPASDSDSRMLVVASILPLADFAREVGGDRVRVEALIPPGASPHAYDLKPSQLQAVTRARVLVLNGVGLEYWADQVISAANNPRLTVVTASEGLAILSGDEDEPGGNPHVWLSPRNAMHQVRNIRDGLLKSDPDGASVYEANARQYLQHLETLDREIRQQISTFTQRRFVSFHAAWAYFARDYGLEEAAVVERRPGQEPSPEEIVSIVRTAKSIGARAIFAEPQFSSKAAEAIAEEAGAQVLFLNPLGAPPDYKYLDLMHTNVREITRALK